MSVPVEDAPLGPAVESLRELGRRESLEEHEPWVAQAGRPSDRVVKSARAQGVPVGLGVASWDHLTTKGLVRVQPDRVFVWNDVQVREAVELHGVSAGRVVVTGAQLFDLWFAREPESDRAEFLSEVGLDPERPYVLYLGSARGIVDPEVEIGFVQRWARTLWHSEDPRVAGLSVLVRPHPQTVDAWRAAGLDGGEPLRVWPRERIAMPMDEESRTVFFHSLFYADAVLGVNTSAMIESAILERPVLTLETGEFAATQGGTVHYGYLLPENGGFVRVAHSLDRHVDQLRDVIERGAAVKDELRRFVERFVRPRGLDRPATAVLADEIERLGTVETSPVAYPPAWLRLASAALRLLADRLHAADAPELERRLAKVAESVGDERAPDSAPEAHAGREEPDPVTSVAAR